MLDGEVGGDEGRSGGEDIAVRLEGRGNHPQNRIEHDKAGKNHQRMIDDSAQTFLSGNTLRNILHQAHFPSDS